MRRLTFVAVLFWVSATFAQDHFNVAYLRSSTQLDKNKVSDFEFSFTAPLHLKNNDYFVLGINTTQFDIQSEAVNSASLSNNMLRLGYIFNKENSKTMLMGITRLNGGNNSHSFQYGGLIHYQLIFNSAFSLTSGILYNTDLFGHFILPFVGIKWKISDKLWLYGDLPIYAHLLYHLNEKHQVGIQFRGVISSHPYGGDNYYEMSEDWICLYYEYFITKNIVIQPSAGIFFIRNINYFEKNEQLDAKIAIINIGERNYIQDAPIHGIAPFVGLHLFYRVAKH